MQELKLDKYSHTISKMKPKIRVIHIVAPQVIKTDVENFRELVQRLTGKSTMATKGKETCKKKGNHNINKSTGKIESLQSSSKHRMKKEITEEDVLCGGGKNSDGFLSFLGDVDCFIDVQEMNDFHLHSFRSSSQMSLFRETHV